MLIGDYFKKIDSIELLDRNFFYDIYRFKCEGKGYCLKLGDRHDNYIFKREYSFLDKIKEKLTDKLENIYLDYTTPLVVTARFSNGETMYAEA